MAKVEVVSSEKANKPNYIWIIIVVIFIGGYIIFGTDLFNNNSEETQENNSGSNTKQEQQEKKLDGWEGRWYFIDKDGFQEKNSYIDFDGKGSYEKVDIFTTQKLTDSGNYKIDSEGKIIFYDDKNEKDFECTRKGENVILCNYHGTWKYIKRID